MAKIKLSPLIAFFNMSCNPAESLMLETERFAWMMLRALASKALRG